MKQSSAYGHIQILSPDGRLMFLTNENRLNFYRKNDLVERIDSKQYRLKFEPKGLGHYDRNTQLLAPRDNRCVRCGNENIDVLTKHHIVPSRFLRHLPEYLKGNNHKYIVLVCRECHDEYCFHENEMDDVLAKKYGVKTIKECNNDIYVNHRKMMSVINAIDKEGLPQSRREKLKEEFHVRTGLDYSEENVRKVRDVKLYEMKAQHDFCKLILEKVKNYYAFIHMWLDHFNRTMSPNYLPNDLELILKHLEKLS